MSVANQEEVMSTLLEFTRSSLGKSAGVAVIDGPTGAGKTFLLERFAQEARAAGAVVLEATGVLTERGVPLGLIDRLFGDDEIVRNMNAARPPEAGHSCDAGVGRPCGPCQSLASHVCLLIEELLRQLDGTSRMVLVVDDLHFADPLSLWVLRSLPHRLQRVPVFLVISGCYATSWQFRDLRFAFMKISSTLMLDLSPFTSDEAAKLFQRATGSRPAAAYVTRAMELTGGNPRLLAAVAHDAKSPPGPGSTPEQVPYPGKGFRESVRLMLRNSHVDTLERVARAMAVLGGGRTDALLGALSGVDSTQTANAVELIEAGGLTTGGDFRHPTIRAAILEDPAFTERIAFHRSAALLLHQQGVLAREVAEYIAAAGVVTEAWETAVLREAARHAQGEGDWHEAVDRLELARTSPCEPGEHVDILLETICAKWLVDPQAALSHVPELISHADQRRLTGRGNLLLSALLAWVGRQSEADRILDRLSDVERAVLDKARSVLTDPDAAPEPTKTPHQFPVGPGHATSADPWRRGERASVAEALKGGTSGAFVLSEQMIRSYFLDADWTTWPIDAAFFTSRLLYHVCIELPAMPCVDGLAKDGSVLMSPFRRTVLHCLQAVNALACGDPARAEREARNALAQPAGWGIHVGLPLSILILSQINQGKFEEVKLSLRIPVPERTFESEFGRLYMYSRGFYRLAIGMHYSALGDFLACGEIEKRRRIPSVPACPWQAKAAHAYLLLDRKQEAVRTAEEVVATSGDIRVKAAALRVLALSRPVADRAGLLREAVRLLEGSPSRVELACSLCELGRTDYALGHTRAGRVLMRRGWSIARFAGFEPFLRAVSANALFDDEDTAPALVSMAAHDVPGEVAGDARQGVGASAEAAAGSAGLLSSAERRVAWLAGIGHSNREVAAQLNITVSTVEQHLTRIYRKLGLRRREDLVTAVPIPPDGMLG
ncbi:AAA family ATPase [Streptomyces sp. NPDC088116]|uniref:helix-turn-helix transcriptional regulator n=1 Tax=Streptomyces sp. NPDC088116 TaxID=3365825 RepID=UPI00380BFDCC